MGDSKENSKEKREKFLGEFTELCESPLNPHSDSLLSQVRLQPEHQLGIPLFGSMLSLLVGLIALFLMLPAFGVHPSDGLSDLEKIRLIGGIVLVFTVVGVLSSLLSYRRTARLNAYLGTVVDELILIDSFLQEFLADLESRYQAIVLSSATTTKVMHYFILVQLRQNLSTMLEDVCVLLEQNSTVATLEALEILQGSLHLSANAGLSFTQTVEVPLYNLPNIVDTLGLQLQQQLEKAENNLKRGASTEKPPRSPRS